MYEDYVIIDGIIIQSIFLILALFYSNKRKRSKQSKFEDRSLFSLRVPL